MNLAQARILLLEDEPDVSSAIQSYLGKRGYLITSTSYAKEALAILKVSTPEIILLDLTLPDIDGRDFLKQLRKINTTIKVIIITGNLLSDAQIEESRRYGISQYLNKPILLDQLETTIEKTLNRTLSTHTKQRDGPETIAISRLYPLEKEAHQMLNLLGVIRNKCENYLLDFEQDVAREKTDQELLQSALDIMRTCVQIVDRLTEATHKLVTKI